MDHTEVINATIFSAQYFQCSDKTCQIVFENVDKLVESDVLISPLYNFENLSFNWPVYV